MQADGTSCEFAIAVADDWRGHGLGRQLLAALFERARSSGLTLIYGRILATNTRMIEFSRRNGFEVRAEPPTPIRHGEPIARRSAPTSRTLRPQPRPTETFPRQRRHRLL